MNNLTRCYVSEQIAEHCNEPEAIECPRCNSSMTDDEGDLVCDDEFNEHCDHVIYAPDEDDF